MINWKEERCGYSDPIFLKDKGALYNCKRLNFCSTSLKATGQTVFGAQWCHGLSQLRGRLEAEHCHCEFIVLSDNICLRSYGSHDPLSYGYI